MALTNFTPVLWADAILDTFENSHVLASLCNRDYEGTISGYGDSVKINSIANITIGDYTKDSTTLTRQNLVAAQTILLIDNAKYFDFEIDDIDKAQNNPKVMAKAMRKGAWGFSDTVDAAIAGLYGSAGTTVTDATMDSDLALDTIARTAQALNVANVPSAGRWLVLPPWAITKLLLAKLINTEGVDNTMTFNNGLVGTMMGFTVHMSNNLTQTGTDPDFTTYGLAGTEDAITFAEQIVSVEAYRPEGAFSDAVKALYVYGYKVVQPLGLVQLALTYTAETT